MTYVGFAGGALLDRTSRSLNSGDGSCSQSLNKLHYEAAASKLRDISRSRLTTSIRALGERGQDWDGHGSDAPGVDQVAAGIQWAERSIEICSSRGLNWFDPRVGCDSDGTVVLEWWMGTKRLTIYAGSTDPVFVASWGSNIETEMDAGDLTEDGLVRLWKWINCA